MHYVALCLLDRSQLPADAGSDSPEVRKEIERLLAPYDENLEVPEHDEECWCVSCYGKIASNCDLCKGTGVAKTTNNPKSKWDWFVIGGRWEGCLDPDYDPEDDVRNYQKCGQCGGTGSRQGWVTKLNPNGSPAEFVDEHAKHCNGCNGCMGTGISRIFGNAPHLKGNAKIVSQLGDFIPFAVVTSDGSWYQHDKSLTNQDWESLWNQIKQQNPDALAVVVDYHS